MASFTDWYLAMWLPTTSSGFLKVITSGFDLLARRHVEAVEREIVAVDADMRVLELAEAVEAALARQQPVDGEAGEGPARVARGRHRP